MIDPEQVQKFSPRDGDVFVVPENTPEELCKSLAEAIAIAKPGVKAMVFRGSVRQFSVGEMNAAGWYRA